MRRREIAYPGMKIGLMGGSFDPAHEGHAHVAQTALKRLGLDAVWWLVTPQNPLKPKRAAIEKRMASARKFARGRRMLVSDFETRAGTRFTVDTIAALKRRFPGVRFVWVMGEDNLPEFHRWRRWADIFRAVPIAVVERPLCGARAKLSAAPRRFADKLRAPRALAHARPPAWTVLEAPLVAQSSSLLRAKGVQT